MSYILNEGIRFKPSSFDEKDTLLNNSNELRKRTIELNSGFADGGWRIPEVYLH